jgi:hypothetical protein
MVGRYDNSIPPRFLALIDCLKIPAHASFADGINSLESISGLLKSLKISSLDNVQHFQSEGVKMRLFRSVQKWRAPLLLSAGIVFFLGTSQYSLRL